MHYCISRPAYITNNALLEAVNQIICSFLWRHKRLYFLLLSVVLPKTYKHTLMCQCGGVALQSLIYVHEI